MSCSSCQSESPLSYIKVLVLLSSVTMKQLTIVCFLFFTFLAFSSAGISREGLVQSEDNFEDLEKDVNSEAEMGKGHVRVKRDRPQDLPCLNLNQRVRIHCISSIF